MPPIPVSLSLSDRYAFVGKTRSGKTVSTLILVTMLLPFVYPSADTVPWQIWVMDTKGDKRDDKRLKKWGFKDAGKAPKDWPRIIFKIRSTDPEDELSVARQVQALAWRASRRGKVIFVVDEYVSCVLSSRSMGGGLLNISQRGGGLGIGLFGCTQEPTGVPRQLLSQATHEFLFNQTFRRDIEWCQKECDIFGDGPPDKHGFFYRWLDGEKNVSVWLYFKDIMEFKARFQTGDNQT